ncbi:MAG: beta-mannanase [Synergistaceae bacterium]|jgi:hypothetical protein|nr:beta-mannanase [Synergistaceae bacterium]
MALRTGTPARILICAVCAALAVPAAAPAGIKLLPPEAGAYHSAHPDFGVRDDLATRDSVNSFAGMAGKKIVWAYVSSHWDGGIKFPVESCRELNGAGVVPLVGIMPWSELAQGRAERLYSLERVLSGDFDREIESCAAAARDLGFPVMIEFGPEANGSWFPWSGAWNGRSADEYGERSVPDGPERFRDAYRRVAGIFKRAGALDVTWVFHISSDAAPDEPWNSARWYYPGDEWVDWIGVSAYGRLRGPDLRPLDEIMRRVYPGMAALSASKPVALLELGVSDGPDKPGWIMDAMNLVASGRYPRLKAVSWWNKIYRSDGSRSTLEIDSSPESLASYREGVKTLADSPRWGVIDDPVP